MTDKERMDCIREALNYTDREAYISDMILSTIWENTEDTDIPADRLEALSKIWDATHRSVQEIANAANLSQRKLSEKFCIPYRTTENWCRGINECPIYTRLMMQKLLNLI